MLAQDTLELTQGAKEDLIDVDVFYYVLYIYPNRVLKK